MRALIASALTATTMSTKSAVLRLNWKTVEGFVRDWEKSPTMWYSEADVQAELAVRLVRALRPKGLDRVEANYEWYSQRGLKRPQFWSRVSCCAPVRRGGTRRNPDQLLPDIAVFKDLADPDSPPDEKGLGRWPAYWVCEIKSNSSQSIASDRARVRKLIRYREADAGMCLELALSRAGPGIRPGWQPSDTACYREYRGRIVGSTPH
jgi:hypothetical protein